MSYVCREKGVVVSNVIQKLLTNKNTVDAKEINIFYDISIVYN